MQGLLAESWVQGSLVGGLQSLQAQHVFDPADILVITDVPNCDLHPSTPCATGSLAGDVAAWFQMLASVGLNGTWAVWDYVDGSRTDPSNYYGDAWSNDTVSLTAKGVLHRAQALRDARL